MSEKCLYLSECTKDSDCPGKHFFCGDNQASEACGGLVTAPSGYLSSPHYPKDYANNLDCEWHINVPEGERIKIDFIDFNVEGPKYEIAPRRRRNPQYYNDYYDYDYDYYSDPDSSC